MFKTKTELQMMPVLQILVLKASYSEAQVLSGHEIIRKQRLIPGEVQPLLTTGFCCCRSQIGLVNFVVVVLFLIYYLFWVVGLGR